MIKRACSIWRLLSHFGTKQKNIINNIVEQQYKMRQTGYSKMNWITNYTTTGKYCKLVNCLAWWRWMSPTAPVVPFSNLLANVFFKKRFLRNSLKKSRVWCNWCVLCHRIKQESILSLCEPRTLFKGFNQNPMKKSHWLWDDGTGSAKMLTPFRGFAYKVTSLFLHYIANQLPDYLRLCTSRPTNEQRAGWEPWRRC